MYQIQKLISLINDNLSNYISKDEVEKTVHYSYRNTERVFKKIFGENLKSYQRRQRLEIAYKQIVYSQHSITDISINVGYTNLQTFSKAFKKQFSITPTQARLDKNHVFESFIKNSLSNIKVEKIYKNTETVFYKSIKSTNYNNKQINKIWRQIEEKNSNITSYESYGIIENQPLITEHKNCVYGFAVNLISDINSDFVMQEIFGGYYLKFIHLGCHNQIEETYKKFYKYWLTTNLELGESSVIEHYIVSEKENVRTQDYVTHIYFPLK